MKKNEEIDVVKVEKIVIKIGDKEVEYTLEEAKKLQELLNNLLGNKETIYIPISTPYPVTVPMPYPVYPRTYPYYPNTSPWIVTYETGTYIDTTPIISCTYNAT
jgi:hypothetical protein